MLYRSRAIMLLVGCDRHHGMGCEVVGLLLEDAIQMRDGMCTVRLILQLYGAFECRQVVGSDAQRFVKRSKGFFVFAKTCESDALQHPEPGIFGRLLQCPASKGQRLAKIFSSQCRLYG